VLSGAGWYLVADVSGYKPFTLKVVPIGFPDTSVTVHEITQGNIPGKRRPQFVILQFRIFLLFRMADENTVDYRLHGNKHSPNYCALNSNVTLFWNVKPCSLLKYPFIHMLEVIMQPVCGNHQLQISVNLCLLERIFTNFACHIYDGQNRE
jgi:hypothetical protein